MDIDAIKSKLATLQSTSNTKDNFWKPEPGKQVVRVVPYKHNKDNPFIELFFHYNLGNNKTYLSPLSFGRPDPVAEFADKLKSTGNKDEWIQGKRLEPKMRTFAPVVVRGKESEGVKFWGFGKTVYQELLGVIADPDYGDITDATNGRDIGIDRQTPAEAGNQYGKTTVRVKPNQTALAYNAKTVESLLDDQKDLVSLFKKYTFDEMKDELQGWLKPSDKDGGKETEKVEAPSKTKKTIDNKLDELFD